MSVKFDLRPAPPDLPEPPRSVCFTKMEGAGNDYIYIEEFEEELFDPAPLAVRMSDRHFGVGGDGIVLIGRPSKACQGQADFRMRMFNADGSESDMCGNASRCVGKYVFEAGLADKESITLETGAGLRRLHLNVSGGRVSSVRVDMGEPILNPESIPMNTADYNLGDSFISGEIRIDGDRYPGTAVSMGNPHLVIPWNNLENLDISLIGPKFEYHGLFPKRVNSEFVEIKSRDHLRMRVWERGCGETLACGTGACAALVACALNGWAGREAKVELRGGALEIEWSEEDNHVYMTGPANSVFTGTFTVK